MIILYPLLAFLSILFTILTMILSPLLALTADSAGNLPWCLRWFQTFDASLDEGWKKGTFDYPFYPHATPEGVLLWWYRTRWLWRNPGYGFDLFLGVEYMTHEWTVHHESEDTFLAFGPGWRFEYQGKHLHLGWKACHNLNAKYGTPYWERIPLVFSVKK